MTTEKVLVNAAGITLFKNELTKRVFYENSKAPFDAG
jgi:hypothetical protein